MAVAGGLFLRWESQGWFAVTGDEPHYLVMARGLAEEHAVEQTGPYALERRTGTFGLAPGDRHVLTSANGSFNLHGLGLPALLVPAVELGGTTGAKVFLIVLSGLAVVLLWRVAAARLSTGPAVLAAVAAGVAVPFVPAANQVYPDMLAGLVALAVIVGVTEERAGGTRRGVVDAGLAVAVACLPWLQVKFIPVAVVAAVALVLDGDGPRWRRPVVAGVVLASLVGVVAYDLWAFGRAAGPYDSDSAQLSMQSLTVFLGLHLDRFQGMFLVHPLLLVGVAETARQCARRVPWAWMVLAMWLGFTVPNALHVNWFGGLSMAGRFGWAAAMVLTYPTVRGLVALYRRVPALSVTLMVVSVGLQAAFVAELGARYFDLYNNQLTYPLRDYRSLHGPVRTWMPAFYDADRAFFTGPNLVALVLLLAVIVAAASVGLASRRRRGTTEVKGPAFHWEFATPGR